MEPDDLYGRVPADTCPSNFADRKKAQVTVSMPIEAGLWKWVRAKADYEGCSHGEAVASLIQDGYGAAKRHGEKHGEGEPLP